MVYSLAQVDSRFEGAGFEAGWINLPKIEVKLFPPGTVTEDYPPAMLGTLPLLETYQVGVVAEGDSCHKPRFPAMQGIIRCGPVIAGRDVKASLRFRAVRGEVLDRMGFFFSNMPEGFRYREAVWDIFGMSSDDLERLLYGKFQSLRAEAIRHVEPFFEHRRIPLIIAPDIYS